MTIVMKPVMGITIAINEIVASNSQGLSDKDGDHPDWIELYNFGTLPVQLKGYILTDDLSEMKWEFPVKTIPPSGYLVIFASGKDMKSGNELHTNFRISSSGDPIYLIDPIGVIIDNIDGVELKSNISFGRKPDGTGEWYYFKEPTPGKPNTTTTYSFLYGSPFFSKKAGFYTDAFALTLSQSGNIDTEAKIYYTLDGSEPDQNSFLYEGSILIEPKSDLPNDISEISTSELWKSPKEKVKKATVVRAKTIGDHGINSVVATSTYFVGNELNNRYTFPVISITTENKGLFDYDEGIYVKGRIYDENYDPDLNLVHREANYTQSGIDWERESHIEYFDIYGKPAFNQNAGIRIHGGASRSFPVKSLRLYARGSYGENWFNFSLYDNKNITASKRFLLRNSGNDYYKTLFRDAFIQQLVSSLDIEFQGFRPSIVFLNGEYWGIHNIRERIDKYYFESNFNIDPESINLLTWNSDIKEGSNVNYVELIDYVKNNDLTEDVHYNWVKEKIDINNYLDYFIVQIFISNHDWPGNNIDYWQNRTTNSKWRWILYDTDHGYGFKSHVNFNSLEHATLEGGTTWPNADWSTLLFRNLLKNKNFRNVFIIRFCDHLNTVFRPDRASVLLEQYKNMYENEILEHINRWGTIRSLKEWNNEIDEMKSFAYKRPYYQLKQLKDFFNLKDEYHLTIRAINPEMGYIKVNQFELDHNDIEWRGFYFDNLPLKIEAVPYEGAIFKGWTGNINSLDPKLNHYLTEHTILTAIFEPDPEWIPHLYQVNPWNLLITDFDFNYWSENAKAGTYPQSIAFRQFNEKDPDLGTLVDTDWTHPYNLTSNSRIIGLNENGIAFINTSNSQTNDSTGFVGAMDVYLNTNGVENIEVSWQAGTIIKNSRIYGIRLQYRVGNYTPFKDVINKYGKAVEYVSVYPDGHKLNFEKIKLPDIVNNKENVQLRWKYYYINGNNGPRPMLSISNINISSNKIETEKADKIKLYPNPNNGLFNINIEDESLINQQISIKLYDLMGRPILILYDDVLNYQYIDYINIPSGLPEGVYIIKVKSNTFSYSKRLIYSQ